MAFRRGNRSTLWAGAPVRRSNRNTRNGEQASRAPLPPRSGVGEGGFDSCSRWARAGCDRNAAGVREAPREFLVSPPPPPWSLVTFPLQTLGTRPTSIGFQQWHTPTRNDVVQNCDTHTARNPHHMRRHVAVPRSAICTYWQYMQRERPHPPNPAYPTYPAYPALSPIGGFKRSRWGLQTSLFARPVAH